jgi:hypothetical protein
MYRDPNYAVLEIKTAPRGAAGPASAPRALPREARPGRMSGSYRRHVDQDR